MTVFREVRIPTTQVVKAVSDLPTHRTHVCALRRLLVQLLLMGRKQWCATLTVRAGQF